MKLHAWPKFRWFSQSAALLFCGVVFGVAGLASQPAHARDAQTVIDPPGRVGRLSDLTGQVWLFSPDAGEWVTADRNRPLTTGDRLSTDASGRAEVRIGSTTLRLAAGTEVEVLRLDDDHIGLQLHSGSAAVRLRQREAADEFELRTPEGRFRTERTGRYRFDRSNDTSHVTVYSGQAHYEGAGSALTVVSGQRAEFWVDARNAAQYRITEPQRDAFSSWNGDRDRSDDRSASSRYVSPEMTGIEDLDRHGRWEQNTEYGALWTPRTVVPGWAPYAAGHWAFVRPWGWTWVDDAPWGFAPFHYGRWVYYRNAWCWAPGTRVARPVYAPALVAWVGGPRVNVSINIGGGPAVGWFPLAPREVYVPSYRVSPRYVQNINITHVTNVTSITAVINNPQAPRDFGNRRFPNAMTVVPGSVLTARQPVAPAAAQMRNTPWVRELSREPRRGEAMVVAPIAAPVALQPNDRRPVALPPGLTGEARSPREGLPPRGADSGRAPAQSPDGGRGGDRNDRRPGQRDEGGRPDGSPNRPVGALAPAAPVAPTVSTPAAPSVNAAPAPRPEAAGRRPGPSGAGDDRRGPSREPIPAPAASPALAQPQGVAPLNRPAAPREAAERPAVQAPAAEATGRRAAAKQPQAQAEERRAVPRAEASPALAPRPPQRVEQAAQPKAVEPPAQVKPTAEVQRPASPDARRPEPPARARAESARDQRRDDARERGDKKD